MPGYEILLLDFPSCCVSLSKWMVFSPKYWKQHLQFPTEYTGIISWDVLGKKLFKNNFRNLFSLTTHSANRKLQKDPERGRGSQTKFYISPPKYKRDMNVGLVNFKNWIRLILNFQIKSSVKGRKSILLVRYHWLN